MQVNRSTTPLEDQALAFIAKLRSERLPVPMAPADLLVAIVDGAIADLVNEFKFKLSNQRAQLAAVATPEDQVTIDGVLAKYKASLGIV